MSRYTAFRARRSVLIPLAVLFTVFVVYATLQRPMLPWDHAGRLIVVARPIVTSYQGPNLSFILDEIRALQGNGEYEKISTQKRQLVFGSDAPDTFIHMLDVPLKSGAYEGISANILNVGFVGSADDTLLPRVTIPGNTLPFDTPFTVREGETTVIVFSFELDQTIRQQEDGSYLFLPVIQVETRKGGTVDVMGGTTRVADGTIEHMRTYGMSVDGTLHFNYREPLDAPPRATGTASDTSEDLGALQQAEEDIKGTSTVPNPEVWAAHGSTTSAEDTADGMRE